jgi:predicted XRE-type DNA-binding protein
MLVVELCALHAGSPQYYAAAMLRLTQPQLSALRRGQCGGFSIGRLLRVFARAGFDIEVHLRVRPRSFAHPHAVPSVKLIRYDH